MGVIKEGLKVKLYVDTAEGSQKEFDCSIRDVYEDRLVLDFPQEILDYAEYFEEGTELPVRIYTPAGIKVFDSIILNSPLESEFTIEYIETSNDIQRREYVRVAYSLKIVIEREGYKNNIITNTVDIGGGGIRFFYEGSFTPGEIVKLTIFIPEERSIQTKGVIIQNNSLPENEHVLSFTEIDEKDRDRIIKICFAIQLAKE